MAANTFCRRSLNCPLKSLFFNSHKWFYSNGRCISTTCSHQKWFDSLTAGNPNAESHSSVLSDKAHVYELQTHFIIPAHMTEYVDKYGEWVDLVNEREDLGCHLVGSWSVTVGHQDQALHLWKYPNGYSDINKAMIKIREEAAYKTKQREMRKILRSRTNQLLLEFSFWPTPEPRPPKHIYEIRTYLLKPGTMIEWGNSWFRGLRNRQANNEPVAGLFSNVGRANVVHHVWAYDDLHSRKETREAAWNKPGWDKCVANTVPLMTEVNSRILLPMPYSPLQ